LENKPFKIVRREGFIKFNRDERGENEQYFPVWEPELYTWLYLLY